MRWVVGYGLYLVSEPHTPVRPPAPPCMSSSTKYNPYPTPAYLITNNITPLPMVFINYNKNEITDLKCNSTNAKEVINKAVDNNGIC